MSEKKTWHELLEARISRRGALKGGIVAAGATALPMSVQAAQSSPTSTPEPQGQALTQAGNLAAPFRAISPTTADDLVLPAGYRYNPVRIYGDEIAPGVRFGYNADYIGYFPIDGLEGGQSSVDGLLTVNHEYNNSLLQYGYTSGPKLQEHIDLERSTLGISVFRVQRQPDGTWAFIQDSHNRMISGLTPCRLTGPAAGTPAVKGATEVIGTVGNCSGGQTPWGTVLSCEENVDDYGSPITEGGFGSGWNNYTKEPNGWVVEVDPYTPGDVPRKHTAMGKFRHENVAIRLSASNRVVAYMGDDAQDSCVYKFISDGTYDPANRAANLRLLETGKLYAADYGKGKWILVDYDTQQALKDAKKTDGSGPLFTSQADVLVNAKAAALALKATPTDRPEDIEIHPQTGHVYIAFTNNSRHGNFHGQIVRMVEANNDPEAMSFDWDFLAVGGPQSGFSSPDNLVFDPYGNLWMVTDISSSSVGKGIYKFQGNNSMFFFNTEGPNAGQAIHFASGPVDCELTGPVWTPDGTTLFLSIQHPGEESESLDALTSHWPNLNGDPMPRPGVVAISGFPGWRR